MSEKGRRKREALLNCFFKGGFVYFLCLVKASAFTPPARKFAASGPGFLFKLRSNQTLSFQAKHKPDQFPPLNITS